ncbi:MAG: hypothetical protein COS65_31290, partial [Armatimonadetes bacterium CG06_land_8_20_14_3_00_66_21]
MIVLAATMSIGMAAAAAVEVPLTVRDHSGHAWRAAPVRGGVPLPLSALKDCQQAQLVSASGQQLPCAVRPIARWYDGSVKWVLVDTQVDLTVKGVAELRLRLGEVPAKPSSRVEV